MVSTASTTSTALRTANLGYPRIGPNRELKKHVEEYLNTNDYTISPNDKQSNIDYTNLIKRTDEIRRANIQLQNEKQIYYVPSNDFSLYDTVLDHIMMFDCIPKRYRQVESRLHDVDLYFAMARGLQTQTSSNNQNERIDLKAMEMKKWFDTNYHYIVPEFETDNTNSNNNNNSLFRLRNKDDINRIKPIREYRDASNNLNVRTRPVILGPITFLMLGKIINNNNEGMYEQSNNTDEFDRQLEKLNLIDNLIVAYNDLFSCFEQEGIQDIQMDEPFLCLLDNYITQNNTTNIELIKQAIHTVYADNLSKFRIRIHMTTYFSYLENTVVDILFDSVFNNSRCNVESIHVDLCKNYPESNLNYLLQKIANVKSVNVSLGVIDGRNVWASEYSNCIEKVRAVIDIIGISRVIVSSSCSLQFVPVCLDAETNNCQSNDNEIMSWLSFAQEKIEEINTIAKLISIEYNTNITDNERNEMKTIINKNQQLFNSKRSSSRINNPKVQQRMSNITQEMLSRMSQFSQRRCTQEESINMPRKYITTTIGSFPQTREVRSYRNRYKNKRITAEQYNAFLKEEIKRCIEVQEQIGLDVLVHGEFERNDMVEYFGENLEGFFITKNGWVQSYGTRCVKPPILFGDISRRFNSTTNTNEPITVEWIKYAQSLTSKPVKGMLTGPITCLQWSFVRTDQPRGKTAFQLALAIREEVVDLETNGTQCIQVDEPAIREGLPLKRKEWKEYLNYAVNAFRLSTSGVRDETQIQTHMCYSDFNDIFEAIKQMDADCLFIESSRSDLKLLNAFRNKNYENYIGLGLYDIHSPRIPSTQEMKQRLQLMLKFIDGSLVWINPDCGLKTRRWNEVVESLKNMIEVARQMRQENSIS